MTSNSLLANFEFVIFYLIGKFKIKNLHTFIFSLSALFFAFKVHATNLTESYSCDTCDYQDAVMLAETLREPLQCEWIDYSGTGDLSLEESAYVCAPTSKVIIIANPIDNVAFKFRVDARNIATHWLTESVDVIDLVMNSAEQEALQEFFYIDGEFRDALQYGMARSSSAKHTSSIRTGNISLQTAKSAHLQQKTFQSANTQCDTNPLHVFTSLGARRDLYRSMSNDIVAEMGNQSWWDFTEDVDATAGGLDIATTGGGISMNFTRNNVDYFIARGSDSQNALSFKVQYGGEINTTNGTRAIFLKFYLQRASSYVDGIPFTDLLVDGEIDLTGELLSNCTTEKLEQIAGAGGVVTTPIVPRDNGLPDPSMPVMMCEKRISAKTCSTTANGRTCTTTIATTVGRC